MLESLFKKRLQHRCFPVKFAKLLRTPSFTEQLRPVAASEQSAYTFSFIDEKQ